MIARPHLQKLADRARLVPPLPAAIVYPCDRDSLQLAISGAFAGFLAPVLVGPGARIRDVAAAQDSRSRGCRWSIPPTTQRRRAFARPGWRATARFGRWSGACSATMTC